jgi:hypothetical protein
MRLGDHGDTRGLMVAGGGRVVRVSGALSANV